MPRIARKPLSRATIVKLGRRDRCCALGMPLPLLDEEIRPKRRFGLRDRGSRAPNPAARLAFERVNKRVAVRGADHLPRAPQWPNRSCSRRRILVSRCTQVSKPAPSSSLTAIATEDPRALRRSGDSLVGGKAPPAAIGPVEAPQQRPQHPQARPGQRPLVLPRLPIRTVVGRRRGPHAGLGIAVEMIGRCRSENLLPPRTQVTRQNKLQCGPFRPRQAQTFPVSGKSPLDCRSDCRGSSSCQRPVSPVSTGCKARPSAGFCFSGLAAPERLTTAGQLAAIDGGVHCACSSAAETLVVGGLKYDSLSYLPANQSGPPLSQGCSPSAAGAGPSPRNMP